MPLAEIGIWSFYLPEDWELKDSDIGVSYMESPDGTKGLYAKAINSSPAEPTPRALADYIQRVHQSSFESDEQAEWSVMRATGNSEGSLYRSYVDLWDEVASYRVLSLVLCSERSALQLTMHDYACADYELSKLVFAEIEESACPAGGVA